VNGRFTSPLQHYRNSPARERVMLPWPFSGRYW